MQYTSGTCLFIFHAPAAIFPLCCLMRLIYSEPARPGKGSISHVCPPAQETIHGIVRPLSNLGPQQGIESGLTLRKFSHGILCSGTGAGSMHGN